MTKQGNAGKFSRVIFINFLLIFVLTNQNEATNDPSDNRTAQEYVIGDELERLELNLYTNATTYSFRLSEGPFKFCEEARNEHSGVECHPKISLSLLKMQCDNSTTNSSSMNIYLPGDTKQRSICMNYTYLYSDMYEAMHKNLKEFKNITDSFRIEPVGKWSLEETKASILVSIHYELFNQNACPSSNYFDCSDNCKHNTVDNGGRKDDDQMYNPNNSICIPIDWICDKKPNCGLCGDADESESVCFWSEDGQSTGGFQYAVVVVSLVVSFMVTPVLVLVLLGRISVNLCKGLRRPEVPFPASNASRPSVASTISADEESFPTPHRRTDRSFSKDSLELPPSYLEVITSTNPSGAARPSNIP
ncbi:unnamed protein product [Allacma fusca]|uniref:Uncharacterized protein n=1 Tax=Allacma fusca TaxID=39272 RepID=A0A8J2LQN3_9HEXA|nr:unnamed protein product [Allacma fusca]